MRCVLCGLLLVLVAAVSAQQQQPLLTASTALHLPFPKDNRLTQAMPPDTEAPPPQQMSSWQVQQQIQKELNSEPPLANTNVKASANDSYVILPGSSIANGNISWCSGSRNRMPVIARFWTGCRCKGRRSGQSCDMSRCRELG